MLTVHFTSTALSDAPDQLKHHENGVRGKAQSDAVRDILSPDFAAGNAFEEDFGWGLDVSSDSDAYFLGCSVAMMEEGLVECFVTVDKKGGGLGRLLGKNKVSEDDIVIQHLLDRLRSRTDVSDLRVFRP